MVVINVRGRHLRFFLLQYILYLNKVNTVEPSIFRHKAAAGTIQFTAIYLILEICPKRAKTARGKCTVRIFLFILSSAEVHLKVKADVFISPAVIAHSKTSYLLAVI